MELALERGAVPVTLDRPRILFFDHRAAYWLNARYGAGFLAALYHLEGEGEAQKVILNDPDVLPYYLWAGLQTDAKQAGEDLQLAQVERWITPFNIGLVFNRVLIALTATMQTEAPGKNQAAGSPAAAAPRPKPAAKGTTSKKPRGSRSGR